MTRRGLFGMIGGGVAAGGALAADPESTHYTVEEVVAALDRIPPITEPDCDNIVDALSCYSRVDAKLSMGTPWYCVVESSDGSRAVVRRII